VDDWVKDGKGVDDWVFKDPSKSIIDHTYQPIINHPFNL